MSTIEEKLKLLLKTKTDIRNALKAKGVEISPDTPFSEYDVAIKAVQAGDLMLVKDMQELLDNGEVTEETKALIYNEETDIFEGIYTYINKTWQLMPTQLTAKAENIAPGFKAYGPDGVVEGNFTNDATATANDIISPKTAYVNGQKITGTITPTYEVYGSLAHNKTLGANGYTTRCIISNKYRISSSGTTLYFWNLNTDNSLGDLLFSYNLTGLNSTITSIEDFDMADTPIPGTEEIYYAVSCSMYNNGSYRGFFAMTVDMKNKKILYSANIENNTRNVLTSTLNRVEFFNGSYNHCCTALKYGNGGNSYFNNSIVFHELTGGVTSSLSQHTCEYGFRSSTWGYTSQVHNFAFNLMGNYAVVYDYTCFNSNDTQYKTFLHRINWSTYSCTELKRHESNTMLPIALLDDYVLIGTGLYTYSNVTTALSNLSINYTSRACFILGCHDNIISFVPKNNKIYVYRIDSDLKAVLSYETSYISSESLYDKNKLSYPVIPKANSTCITFATSNSNTASIAIYKFNEEEAILRKLVQGNYNLINTSGTNATTADILINKTVYVNGEKLSGAMPNNGTKVYTPGDKELAIADGYHDGSKILAVDITTLAEYERCLELSDNIMGNTQRNEFYEYLESTGQP